MFEIRASGLSSDIAVSAFNSTRTANALRRAEVIRRHHLSSLHVEAHLSNRPAPLAARLSVSPWENPGGPLVRLVRTPLWPLRSDLNYRRSDITPCRHSPFVQNRHRSISIPYPTALVTYWQVPCHNVAFSGTSKTGRVRNRWRRRGKLIGCTKQALKRTGDILPLRMMGCLVMTRRVGESSRTRALDLTRQRACVQAMLRRWPLVGAACSEIGALAPLAESCLYGCEGSLVQSQAARRAPLYIRCSWPRDS